MTAQKKVLTLLDTIASKQMITLLGWLVAVALVIIAATYAFYFTHFHGTFSNDPGVWGQFGDFVGGTINPILTFLTFMALVFTVVLQTRQLEHSREELQRSIEFSKRML